MRPFLPALAAVAALVLWLIPLLRMRRRNQAKTVQALDRRARWGVLLEAVGYTVVWLSEFWHGGVALAPWRLVLGLGLLGCAVAISWWAAAALGSHLRIDASLSTEHELIRSGPYGWVRHPVYASFLGLVVGTGLLLVAPGWLLVLGTGVFLCGTEIRVRVEDELLRVRFGGEFEEYRRSVSAYLPGIR